MPDLAESSYYPPMNPLDSTHRFSDRAEAYARYRPGYPPELLAWLHREQGIDASMEVADIGAGTGISTRMFLDAGHRVLAVEPNAPMRAVMKRALAANRAFSCTAGCAEATALGDASVDLISVAEAFHWFDPQATHREFARILRPQGRVAVYWNARASAGSSFLDGYEQLLRHYGTDYARVAERYANAATMQTWFGSGFHGQACFPYRQRFDYQGLRGRLLSCSYTPGPEYPQFTEMLDALRKLFDATAQEGWVDFEYDTHLFVGAIA